ncbi:hypothetical protein BpHYR1_037722 [Brachionus plicatilis]|uniref:Uncharacterized protein n=1 Tax=Brachionus plicatilis TaxID=10195 RepID=A0A3M7SB46_BRAPC|nr:hypothetical protein BpHYR1_037722 [Brachionus plicatilis]
MIFRIDHQLQDAGVKEQELKNQNPRNKKLQDCDGKNACLSLIRTDMSKIDSDNLNKSQDIISNIYLDFENIALHHLSFLNIDSNLNKSGLSLIRNDMSKIDSDNLNKSQDIISNIYLDFENIALHHQSYFKITSTPIK